MPEETIKTEVNLTEYVCDKCGAGLVKFRNSYSERTGEVVHHRHQCENCGEIYDFEHQYPLVEKIQD